MLPTSGCVSRWLISLTPSEPPHRGTLLSQEEDPPGEEPVNSVCGSPLQLSIPTVETPVRQENPATPRAGCPTGNSHLVIAATRRPGVTPGESSRCHQVAVRGR